MNINEQIKANIKSYNKYMTDEYLATLSTCSKLRSVHPLDRAELAMEAKKFGLINEQEYKQLIKPWKIPA
jgi:hypothetical protein